MHPLPDEQPGCSRVWMLPDAQHGLVPKQPVSSRLQQLQQYLCELRSCTVGLNAAKAAARAVRDGCLKRQRSMDSAEQPGQHKQCKVTGTAGPSAMRQPSATAASRDVGLPAAQPDRQQKEGCLEQGGVATSAPVLQVQGNAAGCSQAGLAAVGQQRRRPPVQRSRIIQSERLQQQAPAAGDWTLQPQPSHCHLQRPSQLNSHVLHLEQLQPQRLQQGQPQHHKQLPLTQQYQQPPPSRVQQVQPQQQQQPAPQPRLVLDLSRSPHAVDRWRGNVTATMWSEIDLVRQPLLQMHPTLLGQRSIGSEEVLSALGAPRVLDLSNAGGNAGLSRATAESPEDQAAAKLQRAYRQLQITGGAAAASQQQPSPQQQQLQHQQQLLQRFQSIQLASQHLNGNVRSQRLLQQQLQRQRQQTVEQAAAALAVAFPTGALAVGPSGRVQRAAAAAAAKVWQSAADAAADREGAGQPGVAEGGSLGSYRSASDPQRSRSGKPVRKPGQPRMAEVDPNWKQARFASVLDHPVDCSAAQHAKCVQPEHSTARFAVLTMLHGAGWPNHMFWERWVEAHPPGDVALLAHMKAGVEVGPGMVGHSAINRHRLRTSVAANWGDISLVEATIDSLAEILARCPHVTHIGLASGHDLPVSLMTPGVLLPGVSSFGMYQFGDEEQNILQTTCCEELEKTCGDGSDDTEFTRADAARWSNALTFHHQWMVLSREHAAAVVKLRTEITVIGRVMHRACDDVKADMAPDEFIIVTALRAHGYIRSIQRVEMREGLRFPPGTLLNCYPTMVIFPAESSPHPVLWTDPDEKVKCQLEDEATRQRHDSVLNLRRCLVICQEKAALFFRKVEIRQTNKEQQVELLSMLEQMWAGKSLKKVVSRTTSGATGSKGSKRRRVDAAKTQHARAGSQGPETTESTPALSGSPAGTDNDLHDVQSPVKRPVTDGGFAAAAAAAATGTMADAAALARDAGGVTGLENVSPAAVTAGVRYAPALGWPSHTVAVSAAGGVLAAAAAGAAGNPGLPPALLASSGCHTGRGLGFAGGTAAQDALTAAAAGAGRPGAHQFSFMGLVEPAQPAAVCCAGASPVDVVGDDSWLGAAGRAAGPAPPPAAAVSCHPKGAEGWVAATPAAAPAAAAPAPMWHGGLSPAVMSAAVEGVMAAASGGAALPAVGADALMPAAAYAGGFADAAAYPMFVAAGGATAGFGLLN